MRPTATLCILLCCVFFLGIAPQVWAQPADVGTKICRDVQLLAQATAGEEDDWRNHGTRVRAASHVVRPLVDSLVITEECSSCIMNQFASRIAIIDQEPCGPDRICGDGEIDPEEECDDGDNNGGEGCSIECTIVVIDPCFTATDYIATGEYDKFESDCKSMAECDEAEIACNPTNSQYCAECIFINNTTPRYCDQCNIELKEEGKCEGVCEEPG